VKCPKIRNKVKGAEYEIQLATSVIISYSWKMCEVYSPKKEEYQVKNM